MSEIIYNIPFKYKEGIYGIGDLKTDSENVIALHYADYGDIVTYKMPNREYGGRITLYSIPKNILDSTLKASYDGSGYLKMITVNIMDRERILYIHYKDEEDTRKKLECFAVENANAILGKISICKDKVSRLFVEQFNDGEYMDFHAKIGTEAQKTELEEKYPNYTNIADSCGDYRSENIEGDNDKLAIMISCADNEEFDYFQYAVEIMVRVIEEKAPSLLNKADDFKFLCMEYD